MLVAVLKTNILLAVFALVYYIALRRLTFYQLNRLYFLLAIACAIVYPFINLSSLVNEQQQNALTELVPVMTYELPRTSGTLPGKLLAALFFAGSAVMAIRLTSQFISLYRLHKKSTSGSIHNTPVRLMQDETGPFSFGKHIYINPALYTLQEQQTILEHEKIHVRQWHTLDIVLSEFMLLCCWFNPAAWLMNRTMRENLEFITDNGILEKGFDRKLYQYSLLQVSTGACPVAVSNNFTLNDIRKRIKRMNARRSSRLSLINYSVFPLLVAMFLFFSISVKGTEKLIQSFADKIESIAMPPATVKPEGDVAAGNNIDRQENKPAASRRNNRRQANAAATVNPTEAAVVSADELITSGKPAALKEKLAYPQPKTIDAISLKNDPVIVVKGVRVAGTKNASGQAPQRVTVEGMPLESQKEVEPVVVVGYPTRRSQQ